MLKQITKDEDVVNIANEENLYKSFWKYQNKKEYIGRAYHNLSIND